MSRATLAPFGMVPLEVVRDVRLTRNDIAVYTALSYRRGNNETMWACISTIATDCGLQRQNVYRHIQKLKSCGWISPGPIDRKGGTRHYAVLMPLAETTTQETSLKAETPSNVGSLKAETGGSLKAETGGVSRLRHKENRNKTSKQTPVRPAPANAALDGDFDPELDRLRRLLAYGDPKGQ